MGVTEKLTQMSDQVTAKAKTGFAWTLLRVYQSVVAFVVGLTLGLVTQTLLGAGALTLLFVTLVLGFIVFRLIRNLNFWGVTIFVLICFLSSLSLRLYIQVGPNL